MATPQARKQLHALCYEHHIEMRLTESDLHVEGGSTQTSGYSCPAKDCAVRYAPSCGYFIAPVNGDAEWSITPRVMCPHDGQPMYLAEVNPLKRSLRRWQCPQCESSRTNEEGVSNEVQGRGRP